MTEREPHWVEVRDYDREEWQEHLFIADVGGLYSYMCVLNNDKNRSEYLRGSTVFECALWRQMREIEQPPDPKRVP